MQVRDLSMKSRSNNSSDMSVDNQMPTCDSLIYKSEINELEEIKAEDSYEESDINDLKEHIIHNNSDENYEENSEENEDNSSSIFPKSKISQKDIREIWQANFNTDGNASELIKNITGLSSSTVYRHYQSLMEKGTSNRKNGIWKQKHFKFWFTTKKTYFKANKKWWYSNSRINIRNF